MSHRLVAIITNYGTHTSNTLIHDSEVEVSERERDGKFLAIKELTGATAPQ